MYLRKVVNVNDDSLIIRGRIIEVAKTISTKIIPIKTTPENFNKKKVNCKIRNYFVLLTIFNNYH